MHDEKRPVPRGRRIVKAGIVGLVIILIIIIGIDNDLFEGFDD